MFKIGDRVVDLNLSKQFYTDAQRTGTITKCGYFSCEISADEGQDWSTDYTNLILEEHYYSPLFQAMKEDEE